MKHKLFILYGGISPERDVSIRSGRSILAAAKLSGFDVRGIDFKSERDLNGIEKSAVVLPILHGVNGEDGYIQRLLEKGKYRYLGSNSKVSENCFDKTMSRQTLRTNNIVIADGDNVTRQTYFRHQLASQPHVLKVARGGSSIGTYIVKDPMSRNERKVKDIFALDNKAVVEELVDGIEVTVPVLGDRALPVIEIVPPKNQEFDYENKYNGKTQEICPPTSLTQTIQHKLQQLALQAHYALGCQHLSRTDMIVRSNGEVVVLEINTMPGMTENSLFPKSAAKAGISMPQLVQEFVSMVSGENQL